MQRHSESLLKVWEQLAPQWMTRVQTQRLCLCRIRLHHAEVLHHESILGPMNESIIALVNR